ncbi:MAG: nucleoside deaminase [Flavobacteriales bacterium]|nr:nucleoside deaminase [Flavobacteriales bacterium]
MDLGHDYFMKQALKQAIMAAEEDEVPIGAVVVVNNQIIGKGYNQTQRLNDTTAHAEMLAITAAFNHFNGTFLTECSLYVTVEPCAMCAGAIKWARLGSLVYGASEPKSGFSMYQPSILHPKTTVVSGILEDECKMIMQHFFEKKRT